MSEAVSGAVSGLLGADLWTARRREHRRRVAALLDPYLARRAQDQAHPVIDFLFTYYRLRPGQLGRWHPGYGVVLAGSQAASYATLRGYRRTAQGVEVDPAHLARRRGTVDFVARLLTATAGRPALLGCFGLHEWAMVYRCEPGELRHPVPLRLGREGTDAVVESLPLRCTHYDAFRFFTGQARPRNERPLSRSGQIDAEQPGCLHAVMDLYKYSAKLLPLIGTELLWDAFTLAYDARELDMRAGPYDLSGYGYDPVPVETPAGRADYVRQQTVLAARAASVRADLRERCVQLLGCVPAR